MAQMIETALGLKSEDEVTVEPDWLDEPDRYGVKFRVRLRGQDTVIAMFERIYGRKTIPPLPAPDQMMTADYGDGKGIVHVLASELDWEMLGQDHPTDWATVLVGKVKDTGQIVHRAPTVNIKRPVGGMQAVQGLFA